MIRTNHIAFALLTLAASAAFAAPPTPQSVGGSATGQQRPASPAPGGMAPQRPAGTTTQPAPVAMPGQRMAPNATPPVNTRARRTHERREMRRDRREDRREFRRERREDRRDFRRERREERREFRRERRDGR